MNSKLLIALLLMGNILIITIPYTYKNYNLSRDIKILSTASSPVEKEEVKEDKDYNKVYQDFSAICKELYINDADISATITPSSISIRLEALLNKETFFNLMTLIDEKIPNLVVVEGEVYLKDEAKSTLTFAIQ